jgi:hypothetical protein
MANPQPHIQCKLAQEIAMVFFFLVMNLSLWLFLKHLLFVSNSIYKTRFFVWDKLGNEFPHSMFVRKLFGDVLIFWCVILIFLQNLCFSQFWMFKANFDWCIFNIEASIQPILLLIKSKDLGLKIISKYNSQCNV